MNEMFNSNSELWKMPRLAGVRIGLVCFLIISTYILAVLFLGMTKKGVNTVILATPTTYVVAYSILTMGYLRLNKFAYWIGTVLLGVETLLFLMRLPDTIKFILDVTLSANWRETINLQEFMAIAFFYMAFMTGVLKTIAFMLLLLPSTRQAFGIGKSTQA